VLLTKADGALLEAALAPTEESLGAGMAVGRMSRSSTLVVHRGAQRRFNRLGQESVNRGFDKSSSSLGQEIDSINPAHYLMEKLESYPGVLWPQSTDTVNSAEILTSLMALRARAAESGAILDQISGSSNVYAATLFDASQRTREISTAEMLRILSDRSAIVFDGRTRLEYFLGHIPGALSVAQKPGVPMAEYVSDVDEIGRVVADRTTPLVVYCNGPFCGKSKRLGGELLNAGFRNVRRYQLGTPVWRALVGPMEIETYGIRYIQDTDKSAVFIDARPRAMFMTGSLQNAKNMGLDDIFIAKEDGRLPMDDFNTRLVVFGQTGAEALRMATLLAHNGFNNVKFYAGAFSGLPAALRQVGTLR
jgi:rhodanese-related sulfurtransferase